MQIMRYVRGQVCVVSVVSISNHSHIRQLQFATHAFSQQILQQTVQISICQCRELGIGFPRISKYFV